MLNFEIPRRVERVDSADFQARPAFWLHYLRTALVDLIVMKQGRPIARLKSPATGLRPA